MINPGDYVLSKMGRDKGKYFIVMRVEDEFCYLCDGDIRKSDKPKKKRQKHVLPIGKSDEFVAGKLKEGQKVTNTELRKAIAKLEPVS